MGFEGCCLSRSFLPCISLSKLGRAESWFMEVTVEVPFHP